MIKHILFTLLLLGLYPAQPLLALDLYQLDPAHSAVNFSVSHLVVSTTYGGFGDVSGTVTFAEQDLPSSQINISIAAASINTNLPARDEHLRNSDFLDVENYPRILFKSTRLSRSAEGYLLTGDLTLRGVTKNISFPLKISGPVNNPFNGKQVIGLSGTVTIDRQDYGVAWNKKLDQGGYVVGNEVTINFSAEAVLQTLVDASKGK